MGWTLLALGIIGLVRLVSEIVGLASMNIRWTYPVLLAMDILLSLGLLIAGVGLRAGKAWAPLAALSATASLFVNALGLTTVVWIPAMLKSELVMAFMIALLGPRLVFYAIVIGVSPCVLRMLWSEPGDRRWIAAAALLSALFVALMAFVVR